MRKGARWALRCAVTNFLAAAESAHRAEGFIELDTEVRSGVTDQTFEALECELTKAVSAVREAIAGWEAIKNKVRSAP